MKTIYIILVLLFSPIVFGQTVKIQVRLFPGYFIYYQNGSGTVSNDTGLTQILQSYGVGCDTGVAPSFYFQNEYEMSILYTSIGQSSNLINDLNAYSTVIRDSKVEEISGVLNNILRISLVNSAIGVYQSTIGGIVQTNDNSLNTLFQNYGVSKYENNHIKCNCNIANLKAALNNLNTVISNAQFESYSVLGLETFSFNNKTRIFPNPFQKYFNIETNEAILQYKVFDIYGKQVIDVASKNKLEIESERLNTGLYILNLEFDNGQTHQYKVIKN